MLLKTLGLPPFTPFFIIFTIIILSVIYGIYLQINGRAILNATRKLQGNLSDQSCKEYIDMLKSVKIPNKPEYWNTLRAGYQLVKESTNISPEIKNELKQTLLSRGVDRLR
ncbi:hypothetical protein [Brevibacillus sp. FSL L8-0710]|uniref:hypothetical protein n=1 Tax=Brevibacillus sp. FSL L8-0710 TaxID=2975313 RepID=UPI0030FBBDF5